MKTKKKMTIGVKPSTNDSKLLRLGLVSMEQSKIELAQKAFDAISEFFMKNPDEMREDMLEAADYLGNYLGDIAFGREIKIENPRDAFPSLFGRLLSDEIEEHVCKIVKMVIEKTPKHMTREYRPTDQMRDEIIASITALEKITENNI